MSNHDLHHDWLALIEISGPFLAVPVLKEAFPQGLEELDGFKRKRLRQAYEEWREALETDDLQFDELHTAWIDEVLARGLDLDEDGKGDVLKRADWCAANLNTSLPEHGVTLAPDLAVVDEQRADKPLMLIQTYGQDVDLDATLKLDGWAATPADRMVQLCRATGCRLGLVTNGERWMLVDAPVGAVTTFASWYARIWSQEPVTLQAFVHLLGIRRFFVDEAEQLPALFDRSLKYQDEVTDALGEQVRRAVEVLIQALDKADQDRDRDLLRDVKEPVLYEAALTVMMRLVFLLSAEERGLLLLGDERYEANYALSTLRMQLRTESEEILERRWDAWSRLLAIFRAVFGGIEHENLRLPALGGSLFDPDRFPFLEGRAKGSHWRTDMAKPLPIDNRTVLLLLEAIQQFQGRTLSYRALDVEQIGYVYEGLLERTVKGTAEVTLELDGTKNAKAPWVKLAELESARLDGAERLAELLQERSGSSASRVRNDLAKPVDDTLSDRLLAACHGDTNLRNRIKPFAHLVRTDPWGYPLIYPAGAFIVTTGSDRRETGTHYTPKSLTEVIVTETMTPIAYAGPAEGTPREQWLLKSPAELLDLKICDPAMGSGAFLVQACRWLADRLVEAWSQAEATGKTVSVDGEVLDAPNTKEPLPRDTEARTVIARRLIAERCLYGVDLNPLAVELAKLSIWLVTLAKGRPFGFLDHNLRCGDSLLGIHRLDQLTELSMTPTEKGQQRLFGQNIERAVHEAIDLRQRLREVPIRDIRDVEAMARLDADARRKLEVPERIADAFIGEVFASGGNASALENGVSSLTIQAGQAVEGNQPALKTIRDRAQKNLSLNLRAGSSTRRPFHWPLEFPEIFINERTGFDALIGNPPYIGGRLITGHFGRTYYEYLDVIREGRKGSPDFCVFFLLRAHSLVSTNGFTGVVVTATIKDTGNRSVGLDHLLNDEANIVWAISQMPWPGSATLDVSIVVICHGSWRGGRVLDREHTHFISGGLDSNEDVDIRGLKEMEGKRSDGYKLMGEGFVLQREDLATLLQSEPRAAEIILPYFTGEDVTESPNFSPSRWAIDFEERSEEESRQWPITFDRVERLVKPFRDGQTGQIHQYCFWKYWDMRSGLREAQATMARYLVTANNSKYLVFRTYSGRAVFNHKTKIIFSADYSTFSLLQSTVHEVWARWRSGARGGGSIAYSSSKALATFPVPHVADEDLLRTVGESYDVIRNEILSSMAIGPTQLYNKFHSPDVRSDQFMGLREQRKKMDEAVADAYGWVGLDLQHGFHEVSQLPANDRIRYTISESARLEVLRRLSKLNHKYHEAEINRVTSAPGKNQIASKRGRRSKSNVPQEYLGDLFGGDGE
ncbi:Eco57I restriction-modification methylase domain-containing protein [Xanthomonas nasturtii]|uniref:Eco57I restriction-modification methylase domain-containing protein n=1 Tax=Xanthomonas nasturtii TaxID=1843581 RepID=UPI002013BAE4|nr:type IIL restriction-modification enzyme MmeI [Xanthomonas nasturtii]MCL1559302.1 ATP phosphoribosyltransferase regulatory subunit [Xanthomonas nasturtii]